MKLGEMNVSDEHFLLYLCSLARLVDPCHFVKASIAMYTCSAWFLVSKIKSS